jgi:serine/threonine protein kinase
MPALDPQQWQQVQRILDELDAVPVAARVDRLASMPITDEVVRREAQSLLAAEIRQGDFLEASPYATGNDGVATPSLQPGQVLGSFRIEQLVGRGGMAEVYRARRVGDFEQIVAIKLISSAAHERVEFFQRERRILATLEHPGIARIIDGGVTESGRPYMVMEFVDGTDLVSHAQERRLDLRARLALFRQVCEAVAFAHQHLVVHRDLEPGNVRVTPEGQVKLLDFGIAKLLDVERRDERLQTAVVFTPELDRKSVV